MSPGLPARSTPTSSFTKPWMALLSRLPLAMVLPSGLKATPYTHSKSPHAFQSCRPSETRQSRTVLSSLPLTSVWPSGLKATEKT